MEKEFIPYEQALALKELGFDEPCLAYYLAGGIRFKEYKDSQNKNSAFFNNTVCSIPTFSQAFRWFREVYNIYVEISFNQKYENPRFGYIVRTKSTCFHTRDFPYKTYEEALEIGLQEGLKLIEIVKNGENR